MCIKSAILICTFNVIFVAFFYYLKNIGLLFISLEPLGQIYVRSFPTSCDDLLLIFSKVLSPLLVVYHIAQGKTWAVATNPLMTQDIEDAINRQLDPHTVRLSQIPGSVKSLPSATREIPVSDAKHA